MTNKLDSIILLTTSAEINNGMFFKFCNQFFAMKKTNLTLEIFFNNYNFNELLLIEYISKINIFKKISLHNLDIPPELDIYIKDPNYKGTIPYLGLISGPNYMFFEAMKYCFKKFNVILLLETDCILKQTCFEISKHYIENISDFLISGSRYVGEINPKINVLSLFNLHLNGVAFYNTGSEEFMELLENIENYIKINVIINPKVAIPYDMAITSYLIENPSIKHRRLLSKLINTTYIINCSVNHDKKITMEEIDSIYPKHIIFHTKMNY
jgi:hypothetical protein